MKPFSILLLCCILITQVNAQELYVYTEPASNMPARSASIGISMNYMPPQEWNNRGMQRYVIDGMIGANKKLMLRAGLTFADVHTSNLRWESAYIYGKYRFLSNDDLHSHFRMAAFAEAAYSRSPFHNEEVSLQGDKSGLLFGLIATQLWNKFALSGTVSNTQVLHESRTNKVLYIPSRIYQAMNYSLSGGYLLLPRKYNDYKQTNLNIYWEVLAQQALERRAYYIDFAPAIQFIFNSNTKVNLGYRFQVSGDMQRMANNSFLLSIERTFLNVLKKS